MTGPALSWNVCRSCKGPVDLPDECFDGTEVRCWCGRLYVVVEMTDGTFMLVKRHEPAKNKRAAQ